MANFFESCTEEGESSVSVDPWERLRLESSVVFNISTVTEHGSILYVIQYTQKNVTDMTMAGVKTAH